MALAWSWVLVPGMAAAQSDVERVGSRMVDWADRYAVNLPQSVSHYVNRMRPDGTFTDAPDADEAALRYVLVGQSLQAGGIYEGDVSVRDRLGAGLSQWIDTTARTGSFTTDTFSRPRDIGAAGLLLQAAHAPGQAAAVRQKVADYLNTDAWLYQGSGERFLGTNVAYRLDGMLAGAVLEGSDAAFARVQSALSQTFTVHGNTSRSDDPDRRAPVGLTGDGSYLQHNAGGGQNFWIGYGRDWGNRVIQTYQRLEGTPWRPSDAEINTLVDGYLDGYAWTYYRGQGLYSVGGRHNLKPGAFEDGDRVADRFRVLAGLGADIDRREELYVAADRLDGVAEESAGHRHFYTSDLTVHRRPEYYLGIRTSSIRTSGVESGNGDGIANYHFGDGTTLIFRDGREYQRVRAVWDYQALPGVTAARQPGKSLPLVNWGNHTESDNAFAGGVSDGLRGVTAFEHHRRDDFTPILASKGYFLFDDEMVALGSGIRLKDGVTSAHEVWTTLNQTETRSDVHYSVDGGGVQQIARFGSVADTLEVRDSAWFHQDGVGYLVFADPTAGGTADPVRVRLINEQRSGSWSALSANASGGETLNVFQLSIDHGSLRAGNQASYGYVVLPDVTVAQLQRYAADAPIAVVRNDRAAQAVTHGGLGLAQIVFYESGRVELSEDRMVSADAPAIVMLREQAESLTITVADPERSLRDVTLTISDHLIGEGAVWDEDAGLTTLSFVLPTGVEIGASLSRTFEIVGEQVPEPGVAMLLLPLSTVAFCRRRQHRSEI